MNRALHILNLVVLLLSALAIVIVANSFAGRPAWRERIDATKTRAYSLSQQSRQLLTGLQGNWRIAIVLDSSLADRSVHSQIDEVLKRYTDASPQISVVRIDPSDASSLVQYDQLLAELTGVYKDAIAQYDRALDTGMHSFEAAQSFVQQQGGRLERLLAILPAEDPVREPLKQHVGVLSLLPDQGNQIRLAVQKARRVDESKPLPDFETARSTLAAALTQTAEEADALAEILAKWQQRPNLDAAAKDVLANLHYECRQVAQNLAESADPLKRLPPLELSTIGKTLQEGEAAVVIGPDRAAVIPSAQLFPKSNIKRKDDGGVTFDQRFRGEQLISATIRSLTVEHMPLVVFVHSEAASLLKPRDRQDDLVGVTQMLRASRFEVAEWALAQQSAKPVPAAGQRVVWVIVPPPPARSLEPTAATRALIEATTKLIADGQNVLLNVSPSLVAKYGQADPFATMAVGFGVEADTARLVLESVSGEGGTTQISIGQTLRDFAPDHLIGRAVDGQQAYLGMPVPLVMRTSPNVQHGVVAAISPSETRWIEKEWTGDLSGRKPEESSRFKEPVPLIITAERSNPNGRSTQRIIVSGSGGWMVSNVADVTYDISGGRGTRIALINPGNHELMLASAAWLAGMDDLIAASPVSQEVARLRNVTPEVRRLWMWIVLAGLPGACVFLGFSVWLIRRR